MSREEFIMDCRNQAADCAKIHARYIMLDLVFDWIISSLVIAIAGLSLISGMVGELLAQVIYAMISGSMIFLLQSHQKSKATTANFLKIRESFLDMATEAETLK